MNPLVPEKFKGKGVRGDAESWQPSAWKRTFWDIVKDVQDGGEDDDAEDGAKNEKTWENIDWNLAKELALKAIALEKNATDPTEAELQEAEVRQQQHWDEFYKCNKDKFFKNRMYLGREFPILNPECPDHSSWSSCLEIGCGVGNTLLPLVRAFPRKHFFACDFAPQAIATLKASESFDQSRCNAFVCDVTQESPVREALPRGSVDIVIMVFVLSAISPDKMRDVILRLKDCLKPGGAILFRDYGLYDMTQLRFISKRGRKLSDNYYARADGTRTYFFSLEMVEELMRSAGLEIESNKYDTRELRNRKKKISMYRVWVQGVFRKPKNGTEMTAAAPPASPPRAVAASPPADPNGSERKEYAVVEATSKPT